MLTDMLLCLQGNSDPNYDLVSRTTLAGHLGCLLSLEIWVAFSKDPKR